MAMVTGLPVWTFPAAPSGPGHCKTMQAPLPDWAWGALRQHSQWL